MNIIIVYFLIFIVPMDYKDGQKLAKFYMNVMKIKYADHLSNAESSTTIICHLNWLSIKIKLLLI